MAHALQFYINGEWVAPSGSATLDVIDPSNEEAFATIALGTEADVDKAVAAARAAFPAFAATSREERLALMRRLLEAYKARYDDVAKVLSQEMGAPLPFAHRSQAAMGTAHLAKTIEALETFTFEELRGTTLIAREPIGVVGMITPWNWPINQIMCKVAPALATGCTMVLKPSEIAPLNAIIFAEAMHDAGVPKGVFNLVNGDGPTVGEAIARHPGVDMVSFTGSTRAGILVAKAAADTVKRVHQELGGKSANIILDDADLDHAVRTGVEDCMGNSGQSCNAPTRLFVPAAMHDRAVAVAKAAVEPLRVGPASAEGTRLGPVVSEVQFNKIQHLIEAGIKEGADLVAGGLGRPEGLNRGYYVRPTVFANVTDDMTIAREEIFGPVISILPYQTEAEAVTRANDTPYGLAAYVQSGSLERARRIAAQMRAGNVYINYPAWDAGAPFGGYKQSGNGREYADFGIHEFLEIKGTVGYGAA
ncbi:MULTISPECIES: aldehyde dehydrogenase family protein [unclassified Chelatococcus]|uniref:aldehyde dehydrogenase family protein n=1 Tax=unclassified Chelatococcus TaxID=2638111 RepID=UPI001BD1339F|nr:MULTISPECIES: aldehyde dehydrogenase family protein [unclassified Chelatococcus]CAH1661069.1 3-succinoylsemialdehyde-pyridine dehydrogenase [Hyphomicrobiales bacterium]MBS7741208.1 aldehyde dehydrogenase family protein [Chelatococcus sp. HY11]MBX3545394.1 aldehyde dehydrogenase family protein [Chelatococcus sp.]MCO5078030.1 aldehyde dehydrogenase family protein [Chelatococcus sp.]CAH1683212.1 3-succinoylsemialdehyde-pyridine dehydrogenase [Hyphomicrobiales bacterium]